MRFQATRSRYVASVLTLASAVTALGSFGACSQTPTDQPVRTLERSTRMQALCVQIPATVSADASPSVAVVTGLPETDCPPSVPGLTDAERIAAAAGADKHLLGLVTQTTRGEIAVIDLTAGRLVDTDRATPGFTMLPVGKLPVDLAVLPRESGDAVIVAVAEPNRPALYWLPAASLLGDAIASGKPVSIASWPVCTLPDRPTSIVTIEHAGAAPDLVVTLAGSRTSPVRRRPVNSARL
jgi:hypothetical protein